MAGAASLNISRGLCTDGQDSTLRHQPHLLRPECSWTGMRERRTDSSQANQWSLEKPWVGLVLLVVGGASHGQRVLQANEAQVQDRGSETQDVKGHPDIT